MTDAPTKAGRVDVRVTEDTEDRIERCRRRIERNATSMGLPRTIPRSEVERTIIGRGLDVLEQLLGLSDVVRQTGTELADGAKDPS